jgi:hypothetical protein
MRVAEKEMYQMAIFYSNSSLETATSPKLSRKAAHDDDEMRNLHEQLSCLIWSLIAQLNGRAKRKDLSVKVSSASTSRMLISA